MMISRWQRRDNCWYFRKHCWCLGRCRRGEHLLLLPLTFLWNVFDVHFLVFCVRIFHQVAEYVEIAAEVAAAAIPWFQENVPKCERNRRLEFLVCRRVIEINLLLKGKVKSYWAENRLQVDTYLYTLLWNALKTVGFAAFQKRSSKGKIKLNC